jgi:hypothetical protein
MGETEMLDTLKALIDFLASYPTWAKLLSTGGLGVTVLTLIFAPRLNLVTSIEDTFKIETPVGGDAVPWEFPVTGRFDKVPSSYEVWVMTTDSTGHRYWPQERVILGADKKWRSRVTGIGGEPGDRRTFGVFLVGENGKALLELWMRAAPHKKGLELTSLTTDIRKIQEIVVEVKTGRPEK